MNRDSDTMANGTVQNEVPQPGSLGIQYQLLLAFLVMSLFAVVLSIGNILQEMSGSGVEDVFSFSTMVNIGIGASSIVLALVLFALIGRPISKSLDELNDATQDLLERRDFTKTISLDRPDELGQLAGTFNSVVSAAEELYERYKDLQKQEETRTRDLYNANVALREYSELVADRNRDLEAAKDQLEEANRIKSAFLSSVSHEIRTPLTAILGYADILRTVMAGDLPTKMEKNLENIRSNARALMTLINDILDLSRIEAGRMTVTVNRFPLQSIVDSCSSEVTVLIRGRPIDFVTEISGSSEVMETDEGKVRQIITNLLSNSSKFTDTGEIRLKTDVADGVVTFLVTDSGIGISQEHMNVIFDDFRQVDQSGTRKYSGTGLGLSISKRLAKLLGGSIEAASEFGTGSKFTVTIPIKYVPGDGEEEVIVERRTPPPPLMGTEPYKDTDEVDWT